MGQSSSLFAVRSLGVADGVRQPVDVEQSPRFLERWSPDLGVEPAPELKRLVTILVELVAFWREIAVVSFGLSREKRFRLRVVRQRHKQD